MHSDTNHLLYAQKLTAS